MAADSEATGKMMQHIARMAAMNSSRLVCTGKNVWMHWSGHFAGQPCARKMNYVGT